MFRAAIVVMVLSTPALAERVIQDKTAKVDCSKDPDVSINHGNGDYTFTGTCTKVRLQGANNKLVIENVKELSINGAGNTVDIAGADKIAVTGNKNTVTYKKTVTAKKTAVAAVGTDNKVTQAK